MACSLIKHKDNFILPSTIAIVVMAHCLKTAALLHIYVMGVRVTRVLIDNVCSTRGVECASVRNVCTRNVRAREQP
jgi:hypothetical protein